MLDSDGSILEQEHVWPVRLRCWTVRCDGVPRAGGEGGGEGRDEAWQEAKGVLVCEAEVDEGQDDASVDYVA